MSILAILVDGPSYGLQLKNEFEARTGSIWPLNVGQVYTTLARLDRDGLVRQRSSGDEKIYELTAAGRQRLAEWFAHPSGNRAPTRDELVLKLIMAIGRDDVRPNDVIQAERKAAIQELQDYTKLKRDAGDDDLGWLFVLDSLIFQAEARVRWLDACEARLKRHGPAKRAARQASSEKTEVRR
jgi:DNA-binding PadR family transcriptional regulator